MKMSPALSPAPVSDDITQNLGAQGVAPIFRHGEDEPITEEMYPDVPKTPKNVPVDVPHSSRIEAISFGAYYCAAYRRDGCPDVLLDGADGRPERFPSATAAIKAAELALHFKPPVVADDDLLGARRFHEVRAAAEVALQIDTLGGIVVDGRVIPVEVRRR